MKRCLLVPTLILTALSFSDTGNVNAAEKIIKITGSGASSQYIEEGKTRQLSVRIVVGDKVKWINETGIKHTVTSDVKRSGNHLFDEELTAASPEKTVEFTQALYDAAVQATGAANGDRVYLGYFCKIHDATMGSKIVLDPPSSRPKEGEHEEGDTP